MADLTRFDFNAKNFLTSETVRRMDDAEVGQYILLLAEAWLCGKDTTLPDDLPYLARLAHCSKVSDRVLDKFPVVDTTHGPRRRNDVLFGEWQEAQTRSTAAKEKAERRWGSKDDTETGQPENPASRGNAVLMLRHQSGNAQPHAQTVPNQTVPDQSNQTSNTVGRSNGGGQESEKQITTLGSFKNLSTRHRTFFGKKAKGGTELQNRYAEACAKYGEEIVLKAFEEWATNNQWLRSADINTLGNFKNGGGFWQSLEADAAELVELAATERTTREQAAKEEQERQQNAGAVEANIARQNAEHAERFAHETPEHKRTRELEAAGIGTAESYFAEVERV